MPEMHLKRTAFKKAKEEHKNLKKWEIHNIFTTIFITN